MGGVHVWVLLSVETIHRLLTPLRSRRRFTDDVRTVSRRLRTTDGRPNVD